MCQTQLSKFVFRIHDFLRNLTFSYGVYFGAFPHVEPGVVSGMTSELASAGWVSHSAWPGPGLGCFWLTVVTADWEYLSPAARSVIWDQQLNSDLGRNIDTRALTSPQIRKLVTRLASTHSRHSEEKGAGGQEVSSCPAYQLGPQAHSLSWDPDEKGSLLVPAELPSAHSYNQSCALCPRSRHHLLIYTKAITMLTDIVNSGQWLPNHANHCTMDLGILKCLYLVHETSNNVTLFVHANKTHFCVCLYWLREGNWVANSRNQSWLT